MAGETGEVRSTGRQVLSTERKREGERRRRCSKKRGYLIARERAKGKKKEGSTKTAFADSTFSIGSLPKPNLPLPPLIVRDFLEIGKLYKGEKNTSKIFSVLYFVRIGVSR